MKLFLGYKNTSLWVKFIPAISAWYQNEGLFGETTYGGLERWTLPQPVGVVQGSLSAPATPAGLDMGLWSLQAFCEDIFIFRFMHFNVRLAVSNSSFLRRLQDIYTETGVLRPFCFSCWKGSGLCISSFHINISEGTSIPGCDGSWCRHPRVIFNLSS